MNNSALVFFTDSSYLEAFKILYRSIRENNKTLLTEVDKVLIVDSSVDVKEFENDFIIRRIDESEYKNVLLDDRFPYWHKTFYKLDIFDVKGYDRIVFIESDILCVGDISYLFELKTAEEIVGVNHVNNKWLSPAVLVIDKVLINKNIKRTLLKKAETTCYDGDSPLVNEYLLENELIKEHLPYEYNFTVSYGNHWKNINFDDVRLVHYAGVAKPWINKKLASLYNMYNTYIEE